MMNPIVEDNDAGRESTVPTQRTNNVLGFDDTMGTPGGYSATSSYDQIRPSRMQPVNTQTRDTYNCSSPTISEYGRSDTRRIRARNSTISDLVDSSSEVFGSHRNRGQVVEVRTDGTDLFRQFEYLSGFKLLICKKHGHAIRNVKCHLADFHPVKVGKQKSRKEIRGSGDCYS
jgi:hypothetical protein